MWKIDYARRGWKNPARGGNVLRYAVPLGWSSRRSVHHHYRPRLPRETVHPTAYRHLLAALTDLCWNSHTPRWHLSILPPPLSRTCSPAYSLVPMRQRGSGDKPEKSKQNDKQVSCQIRCRDIHSDQHEACPSNKNHSENESSPSTDAENSWNET